MAGAALNTEENRREVVQLKIGRLYRREIQNAVHGIKLDYDLKHLPGPD